MNVVVDIPDDIAERLTASSSDMTRHALEGFVAGEDRAGRLTHPEVRRMLGFETHYQLESFLKARGVYDAYDMDDLNRHRADPARIRTWIRWQLKLMTR